MLADAIEIGHVPTLVLTYVLKALFDIVRGNAGALRRAAGIVAKLSQEAQAEHPPLAPQLVPTSSQLLEKPGLPAQPSSPSVQAVAAEPAALQPASLAQTAPQDVAPTTAPRAFRAGTGAPDGNAQSRKRRARDRAAQH